MQTFTAPISGNYKLEVWGAQGTDGGKGGYSIGYKTLNTSNKLYICVGSQGSSNSGNAGGTGGYNGGGNGGDGFPINSNSYSGAGGGGGATHIAITSDRGELKNYKNYQQELLLVAGGGGGRYWGQPGVGGGLEGGAAHNNDYNYTITGATQNTGYAFGQGQNGKSKTVYASRGAEGNGGGGGGFYGGYASQEQGEGSDCGGAGGSGYVGDVTNGATIAGDQTFPSPSGGTETGHSGDGYAIITWRQLPPQ